METFINYALVAFAVVLMFGASIFVHELGHFWVALRRGMRVDAFAIGLGPKLWSRVKHGIEYSVRWIPAGGFVRLPQMYTSEALEGSGPSGGPPIPPAPAGSKILVSLAGPAMNLVFAFIVATVIYFVGLPVLVNPSVIGRLDPDSPEAKMGVQEGDRIVEVLGKAVQSWEEINMAVALARTNVIEVVVQREGTRHQFQLTARFNDEIGLKWLDLDPQNHPVVGAVESGMPAEKAGLREGDRFISFDKIPVVSQEHLIDLVRKSEGKESEVVVEREGQRVVLQVTPRYDPETKRGRMGIGFAGGVYVVMKPGPTPWEQIYSVWDRTVSTISALIHSKETGVRASDMSGPIGILAGLAIEANTDYRRALRFLVLLNVSLAILNLLPIPVLDGGHIVMAIIEKIRRRPISIRFVEYAYTGFALLLISFMLYVTFFDVRRLPRFKAWFQSAPQVVESIDPTATNSPAPAPAVTR